MTPRGLEWVLIVAGLALVALFAGVETGVYALNRVRLRLKAAEGDPRARTVAEFIANLPRFLATVLCGLSLAHGVLSFAATLLVSRLFPSHPEIAAAVIFTPIVFVLGEVAPKELFRRHPDTLTLAVAPAVQLCAVLATPATLVLSLIPKVLGFLGLEKESEESKLEAEERVRLAIAASHEEGVLSEYQAALVRNILSLKRRRVAQAMVPLEKVDMIDIRTPLAEARRASEASGRTRVPLHAAGDRSKVVGLVLLYELLLEDLPTLGHYLRDVPSLSPDDKVDDALVRLRSTHEKLAVVVGDDRRALGVVTVKDLAEEITGELRDL